MVQLMTMPSKQSMMQTLALTKAPVLYQPDYSRPFRVRSDFSVDGIAAVLFQLGVDPGRLALGWRGTGDERDSPARPGTCRNVAGWESGPPHHHR